MNPKEPIHFSDCFNIDKATLNKSGVFDPILNFDTKVFVEPLLLKNSTSDIVKKSYQKIFQSAKEIVELAQGDPEIFLLLPLIDEESILS